MQNNKIEGLDLIIERVIKAPRELVWQAWSEPRHLEEWWCPKPWRATFTDFALVAGGAFDTRMSGPEGEVMDNPGSFLEVIPQERVVFTSMLTKGWRPAATHELPMTAFITMEDHPEGTLYTARVLHNSEADRDKHKEWGFFEGWGTCMTQLAEYAASLG